MAAAPLSSTQSGLGLHPRQKFALLPPLGPAAGRASDEVEMQSELAVNLRYEPGRLSRCDFGAEPLLDGGPETIARFADGLDGRKRVIDCFTRSG